MQAHIRQTLHHKQVWTIVFKRFFVTGHEEVRIAQAAHSTRAAFRQFGLEFVREIEQLVHEGDESAILLLQTARQQGVWRPSHTW